MSWELAYEKKLRTAEQALRHVTSGMRVYIQPGCAEPETLVEALMRRAPYVHDVEIVHMMTMGRAPTSPPRWPATSGIMPCLSAATCVRPSMKAAPTTPLFI